MPNRINILNIKGKTVVRRWYDAGFADSAAYDLLGDAIRDIDSHEIELLETSDMEAVNS